jgi:hypothetical protein
MKKGFITLLAVELLISPLAVFAQEPGVQLNPVQPNVVGIMNGIITPLWQFFAGMSVVMFIVAGTLFLLSSGDPGKVKTAKDAFIWGVVGIVVAIAAYSILSIVKKAVTGI